MTLLSVRHLKTYFYTYAGTVKALEDVSIEVPEGQTLGLVGETGCGKSVTALSILRLVEVPGRIVGGEAFFEGQDLLRRSDQEMRDIRGKQIAMIFQNPTAYINPVYTIGDQICDVIKVHGNLPKEEVKKAAIEALKLVEMPDPQKVMTRYSHELSIGMQQRVMIAMALSCKPRLLIADEPTTALDVTVQAQVLKLMAETKQRLGTTILLITHNLGVVAEYCDRIAVMYSGYVVEEADTVEIFDKSVHPYTSALLKCVPKIGSDATRLLTIPGFVPNLVNPPSGCRFNPRCQYAEEICKQQVPPIKEVTRNHSVLCHFAERLS